MLGISARKTNNISDKNLKLEENGHKLQNFISMLTKKPNLMNSPEGEM